MGRMFYATPTQPEDTRVIHVVMTCIGTVVLAFRVPKVGERGYAVGYDFTVRSAVKEMLNDWSPRDEGPGWEQRDTPSSVRRGDDTFTVTILAAFETGVRGGDEEDDDRLTAIATVGEHDGSRWFTITEGEDDGYELLVDPADYDLAVPGARVSIAYSVTPNDVDRPLGLARVVDVISAKLPERDLTANERIAVVSETDAFYKIVSPGCNDDGVQVPMLHGDCGKTKAGDRVVIDVGDRHAHAVLVAVIPK